MRRRRRVQTGGAKRDDLWRQTFFARRSGNSRSATSPGQTPVDGLPLTKKELEIIRLFAAGLTLTEIAGRFNRAISTVATQKSAAMRKLRLKTHADVIRYAQATRLI